MIDNQNIYLGTPLAWPQLIAPTASLTSNVLDITAIPGAGTSGKATIALYLGVTDAALTTLKLQGSNDNSTFTDIADSIYGTATDIDGVVSTLPAASGATGDNHIFGWLINTRGGAYRYYQAVLTVGTGTNGANIAIVCLLGELSKQIGKAAYSQGFKELLAIPNVNPATH